MDKNFTNFVHNKYTDTIRTVPENYWIATVVNNELVFDSWDAAIKGRVDENKVRKLWKNKQIKSN
jgi:hypothetical protein